MKRILIISPMPPLIGGVSISSKRLYDNLKNDGYDTHAYNIKYKKSRYNKPILIFIRFLFIPVYILLHKKYDIIHCHVPGALRKYYIALLKPLYKGSKLFFTIHGDIKLLLGNNLFMFSMRKADRIICVQSGDSSKLPDELKYKAIDIPAFILPNNSGINAVPKYIVDFLQLTDKPKVIMNGGIVLTSQNFDLYGFEDVVKLYFELKEININIRLVMIVNNDNLDKEQEMFVQMLKRKVEQEEDVLFVINEKFELISLFQYCDICLRPTKTDGDSLTVREALAMNCKVIASDASARPDGTIIYHLGNSDDLLKKVVETLDVLEEKKNSNHISADFYKLIKEQYEAC